MAERWEPSGVRPATGRSQASSVPRSRLSTGSSARARGFIEAPPSSAPWAVQGFLPQAGRFAVTGLPGYTGFIPGKVAENVFGSTFQVANERAVWQSEAHRSASLPSRARRMPGPMRGTEVPGYSGFVPGRTADNVLGQTASRGAEMAFLIKAQQAEERRHRVAAYRRGERPPTGQVDYAGYHSYGSMPGIDTRFEA